MNHYKLEGKTPVQCTMIESWVEPDDRRVARDVFGDVTVSTVFLRIDHSFSDEGPPILFETMIFCGPHDEKQWRYATWDEAVEGHQAAVELAKP